MKTSNKLLLGFLILVFLLPVCTFFVLKGIVKDGKYAVKYYPSDDYYQRGTITEKYKAIKIIGATDHIMDNGGMMCVIHHSDSAHYSYYNHNDSYNGVVINDSISLKVIGDTLIVQRLITIPKDTALQYFTSIQRNVDLYLPFFQKISVNNATVQLDNNKTENVSINLDNNANLILGASPQNSTYSEKPLQYGTPMVYKNIHITSSKSLMQFLPNTSIDSLFLNLDNASKLNIPDSVTIKSISGSIDKKATIGTNLEMSKRIAPLVK